MNLLLTLQSSYEQLVFIVPQQVQTSPLVSYHLDQKNIQSQLI